MSMLRTKTTRMGAGLFALMAALLMALSITVPVKALALTSLAPSSDVNLLPDEAIPGIEMSTFSVTPDVPATFNIVLTDPAGNVMFDEHDLNSFDWSVDQGTTYKITNVRASGAFYLDTDASSPLTGVVEAKNTNVRLVFAPATSITGAKVTLSKKTVAYTGSPVYPNITVKLGKNVLKGAVYAGGYPADLTSDIDYTVSFSYKSFFGMAEPGSTVTMWIKGVNKYTGTLTTTYTIGKASLKSANITVAGDDDNIDDEYRIFRETGKLTSYNPKLAVTMSMTGVSGCDMHTEDRVLTEGTDYTVRLTANKKAHTLTVRVTGKGNYTGTKSTTFEVAAQPTPIDDATVTVSGTKTYTGAPIKALPKVKLAGKLLKRGTDYQVSYANNVDAGTAIVIVEGIGEYAGLAQGSFTIKPAALTGASLTLAASSFTYTGEAIAPALKVAKGGKVLDEGIDYTVAYTNNVNKGRGKITVTGKGNYSGTRTKTFTIKATSVANASIKIVGSSDTGRPEVVVSVGGKVLVAAVDYTVSYPSKSTLKVRGRGNYNGTQRVSVKSAPGFNV